MTLANRTRPSSSGRRDAAGLLTCGRRSSRSAYRSATTGHPIPASGRTGTSQQVHSSPATTGATVVSASSPAVRKFKAPALIRACGLDLVAALLEQAWFCRGMLIDVMRSSVDVFGYDIVFRERLPHQARAAQDSQEKGKNFHYGINVKLGGRPSGCVIGIGYEHKPGTDELDLQYRFFGGPPGEPLPGLGNAPVKHAKANTNGVKAVRPGPRMSS